MSGIEVAGLVLGAIPLVIKAFNIYKGTVTTVSKWRRYTREVDRIVRSLRLEHARLESICEKLLSGLVPGTDIEAMMKDPSGPLWRAEGLHDKLGLRLWKSVEDFINTIKDIHSAVDEIKIKLNLVDGEASSCHYHKVQWSEGCIKREFKRATFTLDSVAYNELLDRITNGVTQIDNLLNANIALEPPRRRRSQWRFYKALRDVSSSLFQAFRSVLVCPCLRSHVSSVFSKCWKEYLAPDRIKLGFMTPTDTVSSQTIDFGLRKPSGILLSGGQDDETLILKAVDFQVAVTYQARLPNRQSRTLRDGLIVRPVIASDRPPAVVTKSPTISTTTSTKKSVRFSGFSISSTSVKSNSIRTSSAVSSLVKGASHIPKTLSLPVPSSLQDASRLVDLCQTIQGSQPPPRLESAYGYICDESSTKPRRYQLYPTSIIKEDSDTISLGTILRDKSGTLPHLSLETRFYLAVVLASSFLQLSETGWLPENVTHQDVFFIKRNGTVSYREPTITKSLTQPATPGKKPHDGALPYNAPLFSLGILLIELILVTPFHDLMKAETLSTDFGNDISKHIMEYNVAMSLLDRVKSTGDEAYKNAVRRCIDNEYRDQSFEDEGIQQFLYAGVIELLEQGLRMLELPINF